MNLTGIHHVTAVASDPARNAEFFTRVLGLRMIKQTVNFDEPDTYHLYYGDRVGTPGTALTYFPFPRARRGVGGVGQATAIAFHIPVGSSAYWRERLREILGTAPQEGSRFGEEVLTLADPDGLLLELVESAEPLVVEPWEGGGVPSEHALRGFHGVSLALARIEPTERLLAGVMGAQFEGFEGNRRRLLLGEGAARARIDLLHEPDGRPGRGGAGTVHHVAWRTPDDAAEEQARRELIAAGIAVSPVIDRNYFHSIYYREPGGVLFEIATDHPGFAVDEPEATLGKKLMLPPWLEAQREEVEAGLPPLTGARSGYA
jgi:glyoxalase family protein